VLVERAAEGLIGMLQWIRFLRLVPTRPGGPAAEVFLNYSVTILNELNRDQPVVVTAKNLMKFASDLRYSFDTTKALRLSAGDFAMVRVEQVKGDRIRWFDAPTMKMTPAELDKRLAILLSVPPDHREQALGWFRFRFTETAVATLTPEMRERGIVDVYPAADPKSSHYFMLDDAALVNEPLGSQQAFPTGRFSFLILPPSNPVANPKQSVCGTLNVLRVRKGKQLNQPLAEAILQNQVQDHLREWTRVDFTGAVGEWTVVFWARDVTSELDRINRITECRDRLNLTLRVPYVSISED
jgi:hypothetical protein